MNETNTEQRLAYQHHDPERDAREGDYALIAAVVIEAFNPPDDDVAEEALLVEAVYRARDWIAAQPCTCVPEAATFDVEPCGRCDVLGRVVGKEVDR